MTRFITGLFDRIDALDTSLVSKGMILYGGARAYNDGDLPYIDNIHYRPRNESWLTHEAVQQTILKSKEYQGRLYAGAAGQVNMDYIAVSRAPAAILYDINPLQKVFWDKFIERLAENDNPDDFAWAMDGFAEDLYHDLSESFNFKALRQAQIDNNSRQLIDISPPTKDRYGAYVSDYSSPLRGSGYKDFDISFRTAAGHDDTGWSCGRAKELNWMQNLELFDHLHCMAKEGAIGTLTLDITDSLACAELAEALEAAGEKVGCLYTSNIGHYLQWSAEDIEKASLGGKQGAVDYSGKPVTTATWQGACENLRLLCRDDALVLRFDQHNGVDSWMSDFSPPFTVSGDKAEPIPTVLDPGGLI